MPSDISTRVAIRRRVYAWLTLAMGAFAAGAAFAQAAPSPGDGRAADVSLCVHAKAPADAIAACTRLLTSADTEKSLLPEVFRLRGVGYIRAGDYQSAVRDFGEAIDRRLDFADAYDERGVAKFKMHDNDSALADLNRAIGLNARAAIYYAHRGMVLNAIGEYGAAVADFGRALKIDDKLTVAYSGRAFSFFVEHQPQKALDDYSRAIALAPGEPSFYISRAQSKGDLGRLDEAIADLDKAVELAPSAEALMIRGETKRLKKDLNGAMADANRAVETAPGADGPYINRAAIFRDKGDFDAALGDLDQAIAVNPKSELAYANRGKVFRLKGDLDRALRDADKAVELAPKNPLVLTWRGDASRAKGEYDKAIAFYDNANHFLSDYVAAIVGRGLALEAMGRLDGASAEFERALKLPADSDRAVAEPAQAEARAHLAKVREAIRVAAAEKAEAERKAEEARKADEARKLAEAKLAEEKRIEEERQTLASARQLAAPELPPLPDPGVRVAMVIGMSNYQFVPTLANPNRDAEGVAQTLRDIGFNSVTLVEDAGRTQLAKALREFQDQADTADWAMVYYAGHGIEIKGQNYLIPVDAKLETDRDVEEEAIALDRVLDRIHSARKLQLVVLDACRNNPFTAAMRRQDGTRGVDHQRGLARIEPATPNELVVYAAKDGEVAVDGENNEHSPFAAALMTHLREPRVEMTEVFRRVTRDVYAATKTKQRPFVYGDSLDQFYFNTK